jgi:hypothetical protein
MIATALGWNHDDSDKLGSEETRTVQCLRTQPVYDATSRVIGQRVLNAGADSAHFFGSLSPDGSSQNQSFTLDGLGRIVKAIDRNDSSSPDDDVTLRYSFDSLGRVRKEGFGENAGAAKWETESLFNPHGFRSTLKYPGLGSWPTIELNYAFDKLGRLTSLVDPHGAAADETLLALSYAGAGRLIQADRSDLSVWSAHNGTTTDFDKAGRRTNGRVSTGSTVWFEEQISYDLNDQVTQVKWPYGRATAGQMESQRYRFDELGRLTQFEQGQWENSTFTTPLTARHD